MRNWYPLTKGDMALEIKGVLNDGAGEILDFVLSEMKEGRVVEYDPLAIKFKLKRIILKRIIQYKLLTQHYGTGKIEIHLTFAGFIFSSSFESYKSVLECILKAITNRYEATGGKGEITSKEVAESIWGEASDNEYHKMIVLLVQLFESAPHIFSIPRVLDGIQTIKANDSILDYPSFDVYLSKCIEVLNLQFESHPDADIGRPTIPNTAPRRDSELNLAEGLDDKLPIFKFSYIKNNFQSIIDLNVKNNLPVSLVMIDIDHLKSFNTLYGLLTGDDVLIATASKIMGVVGDKGKVIRFGGEEISVILPNYTIEEAKTLAERIRQEIEEYPFKIKKKEQVEIVQIKVSLGVTGTRKAIDYKVLIEEADKSLRLSKLNGRNRVTVYNEQEVPEKKVSEIQVPSYDLRSGLEYDRQWNIYYNKTTEESFCPICLGNGKRITVSLEKEADGSEGWNCHNCKASKWEYHGAEQNFQNYGSMD